MVGSDYVGADYVGEDLDYLLATGAINPAAIQRLAANARQLAPAMGRRSTAVNKNNFALARQMPAIFLGFSQAVTASGAANATSEGSVPLRPTDLVVRASNAGDFTIDDLQVGRVNLMAGATAIPAEAFNTSVVRPPISAPELKAGVPASIGLNNLTAAATTFRAMYTALDLSRYPVSP